MKHLVAFVLCATIGIPILFWCGGVLMAIFLPDRNLAEPILAGGGWIRRCPVTNHELFWVSPWQSFIVSMARLIPRIHNKIAKENAMYLEIVREYKPQIIAQYDEYEAAFKEYEYIDRRDPDVDRKQEVMRRREHAAKERVHGLTSELQKKLNSMAWPYRNIADFELLLWAHGSDVDRRHVDYYWGRIENFLIAKAF
jgi:hypothetical protein